MRSYNFRLYPSKKQKGRLFSQFNLCCELYNILLERCKTTYKTKKVSLHSRTSLNNIIKEAKTSDSKFTSAHSQVLQNCSDRLSKAYTNFFRRVKEKKQGKGVKTGFPRFKKRVKSITYPQSGFKLLSDKRLHISKVGNIPFILHRLPRGKIKTLTIKRNRAGQWFAAFSCEVESSKRTHPHPDTKVGIDVGIENFATLSNGEAISNPRFLVESERKLKKLQRRLSRKKKGSANRGKAIYKVAKCHIHIANQRTDFLHQTSNIITKRYGFIGVETLNINGMLKNHCLAKHIVDASWGKFLDMLSYKAESAGGQFVKDKPFAPTSQTCPKCDRRVPKKLSDRVHKCKCGYVVHRDVASANVILNDTAGRAGSSDACGDLTSTFGYNGPSASRVAEAGTTCDSPQLH
ncbi:MAG: transposase [Candidatus Altiarchaeota archaeon]|nr:transposase [Candidatus Altiarchaeota archaeon]